MSKFIEVEKALEPYKGLEDSDIISIWLLKENLKQQSAVEVVSKEEYDRLRELYTGLLESASILSAAVREYERREENGEI